MTLWLLFWATLSLGSMIPTARAIRQRYSERNALLVRGINGRRKALAEESIQFEWLRCSIHAIAAACVVSSAFIQDRTNLTFMRNSGFVAIELIAAFNSYRSVTSTRRLAAIP